MLERQRAIPATGARYNVVIRVGLPPTVSRSSCMYTMNRRQLMDGGSSSVHFVIFHALIVALLLPLSASKYI